jgi:hypothetical protein
VVVGLSRSIGDGKVNKLVDAITTESIKTLTTNGAVTYSTSASSLVDMFFRAPSLRGKPINVIRGTVLPAFNADPEVALRITLWLRDVRGGAGERDVFFKIVRVLLNEGQFDLVGRILTATFALGRAKDVIEILEMTVGNPLAEDVQAYALYMIDTKLFQGDSLMAKWTPRKGRIANLIRSHLGMNAREYRKLLVSLTHVVETDMCANNWGGINYSHVPSVAMNRYKLAFHRNDPTRFSAFVNRVINKKVNPETGKVEKINSSVLYPYEVISSIRPSSSGLLDDTTKRRVIQAQWESLPDYVPEDISFIPIIDTSGSMHGSRVGNNTAMYTTAMHVAVSLGIYLAERNKGAFKDLWMSFSTNPRFNRLAPDTNIVDRVQSLDYNGWSTSTNLNAAIRLLLETAVDNNVPASDMPNFLLILSDMEFNTMNAVPPGDELTQLFNSHGYNPPNVVWWNISGSSSVPVKANDKGMALVSGLSPTIVQSILGGAATPWDVMLNTVMSDRYKY